MRPFNLNLAKQGRSVCTKDGLNARIICFDKKGDAYPIVALVSFGHEEVAYTYTSEGHFYCGSNDLSPHDLMMASVKREGWVNLYKNGRVSNIFDTKEKALDFKSPNGYITTIKISWEE